MKFLYVADFSVPWSSEEYVAEALEAEGHEVVRVEEGRATVQDLAADYDVLLVCKGRMFGQKFGGRAPVLSRLLRGVRNTGKRVVCWVFEAVYQNYLPARFEWARDVAPACDLFLTTASGDRKLGPNVRCLRQGYPGPLHTTGVPRREWTCDAAHVGTLYRERYSWFKSLPDAGLFTDVRGDALADLMRSVKVVVGPPWPAEPGYWSNRLYVVAGYGGCLATPTVDGMAEEGWEPGIHYLELPWDSVDYISRLKEYISWPMRRIETVRAEAAAFCRRDHTYRHRVRDMIGLLRTL